MIGKLNNYLKLIRFSNPSGTILLFLPVLFAYLLFSFQAHHLLVLILFAFEAFLMRSAGCIINDIIDMQYDKKVARTKSRPLASGEVKIFEAIILLSFILLLALLISLFFQLKTIIFASLLIIPIVIYPFTKRFFILPQLFLGLVFNSSIFILALELNIGFDMALFILYIATVFWTIAYDTIYAHQDKLDDKKLGLKSSALTFSSYNKEIIILCYSLFFFGFILISLLKNFSVIIIISLFVTCLITIIKLIKLNLENSEKCKNYFKNNNLLGFLLAIQILIAQLL
ncbi:MAG: 4-hydroxybenzoate octaprenyltransferase [Rickettsiales bacterium]|nr:4-hydroxybenzoate octaprenyltransferase [Rickettsiales bacterium]